MDVSCILCSIGAGATVINDGIDRSAPNNVVESHLQGDHHAPTVSVQRGSVPATAGYSGEASC